MLNHVCLHQTVIGQEAMAQIPEEPDVVVGCVGGLKLLGIAFPTCARFGLPHRFVAAIGSAACPTLTRGAYRYDFGDTVGMTPLLPMYTLGHDFVPPPVHAGGLRRRRRAHALRPRQGRRGRAARLPPERDLRRRGARAQRRASSCPRAGP